MSKKGTSIDVPAIANLARIQLSQQEIVDFTQQIKKVLGYFDILKSIKNSQAKTQSKDKKNKLELREDTVYHGLSREEIFINAPDSEREYIKVKAVFTNETE